jgi:hypothetical protein
MWAPPSLMDDVDAVQAQIARNMLDSGDWVTARLDGVAYLEKAPLPYWMMAVSFGLFGVSDTAARLPLVLSVIALCWVITRFGRWAFGAQAGFYAGLALATSIGLFLFTRILIPDASLTLAITLALWAMLRALDDEEPRPRLWAAILAASIGIGLLLKGLIAVLFPVGAGVLYLLATGELLRERTWRRLQLVSGLAIILVIAAPWHILATLANPPYFDFTLHSGPGEYRGFFWFYFLNEHVLRFLNLRYPRDYNTVPRHLFWLFHLLWFFPWSVYLARLARLTYRGQARAEKSRLLALCWAGFVLIFFTFSTTQEYYSMPAYPAFALLFGCALAEGNAWVRVGTRVAGTIAALALAAIVAILIRVWNLPAPGDISQALAQNPGLYTLSLGHMGDLTIDSFAYLRAPLGMAGIAFLLGAAGAWMLRGYAALASLALMMVLFFHAARQAMVVFDPYLSSRPLADALLRQPPGKTIFDDQYYTFSSVFFYANMRGYLLNGRVNNLEYGSYAPGAPQVFLKDADVPPLWRSAERWYLLAERPALPRLEALLGKESLHVVHESGGKFLLANHEAAPQQP